MSGDVKKVKELCDWYKVEWPEVKVYVFAAFGAQYENLEEAIHANLDSIEEWIIQKSIRDGNF